MSYQNLLFHHPLFDKWWTSRESYHWMDKFIHAAKSQANRWLLHTARGEAYLLGFYRSSEEIGETSLMQRMLALAPDELKRRIILHHQDEERHAQLLTDAINSLAVKQPFESLNKYFQNRTLQRFEKKYMTPQHNVTVPFKAGSILILYAWLLMIELGATRTYKRHIQGLTTEHPHYLLMQQLGREEEGHVKLCLYVLDQLVDASEYAQLDRLLTRLERNQYRFGLLTTCGMWGFACYFRFLDPLLQRLHKKAVNP